MRLIRLSANQASFKTIEFNPVGLSIIVGSRSQNSKNKKQNSYNGVGKSLAIELIHFCLGSNKNKAFEEHLPDWEFSLEFKIGDEYFVSRRNAQKQNVILLNEEELKIQAFCQLLEQKLFRIPENTQKISFRALLPRFIRRYKADYVNPKETKADYSPTDKLLRNLFLLGLDIHLALRKMNLKIEHDEKKKFKKSFANDSVIKEYFTKSKDPDINISHLEKQIQKLEKELAEFQVAENYSDIEQEANQIAKQLHQLQNQRVILQKTIENIEKGINIKSDITRQKLMSAYEELEQAFKPETLKHLEEVETFQQQLLKNRITRLTQEKIRLQSELEQLDIKIRSEGKLLDKKLVFLSENKALDQYVAVNNKVIKLQNKLQKLKSFQEISTQIDIELSNIKAQFSKEELKATKYLEATRQEREERFSLFANIANRLYPDAPAGITLYNNTGENQLRYDFDVKIENHAADGINNARIFCYDFTVLLLQQNHKMEFIWHDSRLFTTELDAIQRAEVFKIANEYATSHEKQYIATLSEDDLETMREYLTDSEFKTLFSDETIVCELDANNKLLGMQVNMEYQPN
ncbi:DUF2326 domain-containing protein [Candidatus Albibeggiatoa sp. nov. BB20]|uniref:DUF2326 domain-containing protein n=1 Tax=Candidatus Albibeggiatoa sp. nov. BB20 TaxID=3162723 RepID=UPI0033657F97